MTKQPARWQHRAQRLAAPGRPELADEQRAALFQSSGYASRKRLSKNHTVDKRPLDKAISMGHPGCLDEER